LNSQGRTHQFIELNASVQIISYWYKKDYPFSTFRTMLPCMTENLPWAGTSVVAAVYACFGMAAVVARRMFSSGQTSPPAGQACSRKCFMDNPIQTSMTIVAAMCLV